MADFLKDGYAAPSTEFVQWCAADDMLAMAAAWLLSKTGNVNMVWWSFVIAELASVTLSFIFFARLDKKIIEPMYDNAAAVQ